MRNNKKQINEVLDESWKKTIDKCKYCINSEWLDRLGLDEEELLIDIKNDSILNIYLHLKNNNYRNMTIEDGFDQYLEDSDQDFNIAYAKSRFSGYLNKLIESFQNLDSQDIIEKRNSDFYLIFFKKFLKINNQNKNGQDDLKLLLPLDPGIFYEVIRNWDMCPHNPKYNNGMLFKELSKFYYELYIKLVKSDIDIVNKSVKAYEIERLFNFSFIFKLLEYLYDKKDEYKKYTYPSKDMREGNINLRLSDRLLIMYEIISIPMAFSRNKFIEKFESVYKDTSYTACGNKIRNGLFYLRSYLVPLLRRTYYRSLLKCINKSLMVEFLKEYIEENADKSGCYYYEKISAGDKAKNIATIDEALQVNVTRIVYNYEYDQSLIINNREMSKIMEKLESEFINEKYSMTMYSLNFPHNQIYANYIKNNK